jgi:hypothetical protein
VSSCRQDLGPDLSMPCACPCDVLRIMIIFVGLRASEVGAATATPCMANGCHACRAQSLSQQMMPPMVVVGGMGCLSELGRAGRCSHVAQRAMNVQQMHGIPMHNNRLCGSLPRGSLACVGRPVPWWHSSDSARHRAVGRCQAQPDGVEKQEPEPDPRQLTPMTWGYGKMAKDPGLVSECPGIARWHAQCWH